MSMLSIRLTLAATLSAAVIAGAIALTASEANAKSRHYHANGTGIGIGVGSTPGGAVVSCRHKRIFFEGCWWMQRTCNGQVTFPKMLYCPDLRR